MPIDSANLGYTMYGGLQNTFYDSVRNSQYYDNIGKFIKNNGCGLIAFSDMMIYLANYHDKCRSLSDIDISSYSEGYISFNDYQFYVRNNYCFYSESFLFDGLTIIWRYKDLCNMYFENKEVSLNADYVSLYINNPNLNNYMVRENVMTKKISDGLKNDIPIMLSIDGLTKPRVYRYVNCCYKLDGYIDKPFQALAAYQEEQEFNGHAVVITGIIIDSVQNKKFLQVSSWGSEYVIELKDLIEEASCLGSTGMIIIENE